MSKLNYNLQAAIELRGQTYLEAGYADSVAPQDEDEKILFKDSIDMTSGHYKYSQVAYWYLVLAYQFSGNEVPWRALTKNDWKIAHRNYRLYVEDFSVSLN